MLAFPGDRPRYPGYSGAGRTWQGLPVEAGLSAPLPGHLYQDRCHLAAGGIPCYKPRVKHPLLLLALLALLVAGCSASSRVRELTVRASRGDAQAQYELGQLYLAGQEVPRDPDQARRWLERAAEARLARAQFALGQMHEQGLLGAADYKAAAGLYYLAAVQGLAEAQERLGWLLLEGRLGGSDLEEAVGWLHKAAAQGQPGACYGLGLAYARGQGVEQDLVRSYAWLKLAAAGGNPQARRLLHQLSGQMTRTQLSRAEDLAAELSATHPSQ